MRVLLLDTDADYFDFINWFVGLWTCLDFADLLSDFHPFDDPAKHCVLVVQPRLVNEKIVNNLLGILHNVSYFFCLLLGNILQIDYSKLFCP